MPTATTLVSILRDLNRDLGQAIGQVPTQGQSTSGGSTTTLIDSALTMPDAGTGLLDGVWLRIDALVGSGPASGLTRIVRKAGFAGSSGTITVAAFGQTIATLTDYSLWRVIHPARALLFVQLALRLLRQKTFYPWSLLTNPDFAAVTSGAGPDSWTATNLTQTTTAGYSTTQVRHGVYAARLLLSGASGKLVSQTVDVVPGAQYIASVAARVAVGTGKMRLLDITNASATLAGTVQISYADRAYAELEMPSFTMPATTYQVAMEIAGTSTSDDIAFDDAFLWRVDQRDYDLPSWVEDPADIGSIGYFWRGRGLARNEHTYSLDNADFVQMWSPPREIDEGGAHPFRLRLEENVIRPLYIHGYKPATTLSADLDTTTVDRQLLVKMALWLIFDDFATTAQEAGKLEEKAGWLERRANVGNDARLAGALGRFAQENFHAEGLRFGRW